MGTDKLAFEVERGGATGSDVTGRGPDQKSRCDMIEGHVTPWVRACATEVVHYPIKRLQNVVQ